MRKVIFMLFILFTSFVRAQEPAKAPEAIDTTFYSDGTFSVRFTKDMRLYTVTKNGVEVLYQNGKPFTGPRMVILDYYNLYPYQSNDKNEAIISSFGGCWGPAILTVARYKHGRWIISYEKEKEYR